MPVAPIPPDLAKAIDGLDPDEPLLVALDFDGTLAHLVPEPAAARPAPGVLAALQRLAAAGRTEVVIISGRALHDLAQVSGAADLALLVGSHGQEQGTALPLSPVESAALARLRAAADQVTSGAPGAWREDKPAGFAVHVRACAPQDADRVVAAVRDLAAGPPAAHVVEGKQVIELSVRPLDKGTALRALLDGHRRCRVLFAGDDVTDEAAMAVLGDRDVTIKVGAGPTIARHRIADPAQLVAVLVEVARARGA
jgi:trehalose 6-phosphate phosphatase